jgi:glycerophosphoryl diester phosphodiesterase
MSLPIKVPPGFRIIAHRGASAYAPENTTAAFRLADEMGAHEVELDAQLTADGEVALCHDRDLARYGHGPRVVEEMGWAELAALDTGSWFSPYLYGGERMLRLDDVFAAYGDRFVYHVEIKGEAAGLPAAVRAVMDRHGLAEACIVTSFSYDSLAALRAIDGAMRMGWLVREVNDDVLDKAQALGLFQICPQAAHVTPQQVALARTVVPEVRAWGLSGTRVEVMALIRRVLDAGCDGMTIDWPDWVSV